MFEKYSIIFLFHYLSVSSWVFRFVLYCLFTNSQGGLGIAQAPPCPVLAPGAQSPRHGTQPQVCRQGRLEYVPTSPDIGLSVHVYEHDDIPYKTAAG